MPTGAVEANCIFASYLICKQVNKKIFVINDIDNQTNNDPSGTNQIV